MVSDEAAAVGGSSVPGPIANPSADWLFHLFVPLQAETASTPQGRATAYFEIDSKAMRRVKSDETVVFVHEISTGAFASVLASGGVRVLSLHV